MTTPVCSVIIPTVNRPHYLPRAVESALSGIKPGEVEVIVVPNGPDESCKESLKSYQGLSLTRILRLLKEHYKTTFCNSDKNPNPTLSIFSWMLARCIPCKCQAGMTQLMGFCKACLDSFMI